MARYIDAEEFEQKLEDKGIFFPALFRNELIEMPTADVVPKSEVEELIRENESLAKTVNEGSELIRKMRSKIDEIKKDRYQVLLDGRIELIPRSDVEALKKENERLQNILDSYALQYGTVMDKHTVIEKERADAAREIFEEIYEDCFDQFGYINYEALAELKKKYTEEK